jgi:SUN domain-containing protein 1/2
MDGAQGFVTVRTKYRVRVSHVTLQHLHPAASVNPGTAPRRVRVIGLTAEQANTHTDKQHPTDASGAAGDELGAVEYHVAEDPLQQRSVQTFAVRDTGKAYQFIKFQVDSNHGAEDFTCLYRVRVHGEVVK